MASSSPTHLHCQSHNHNSHATKLKKYINRKWIKSNKPKPIPVQSYRCQQNKIGTLSPYNKSAYPPVHHSVPHFNSSLSSLSTSSSSVIPSKTPQIPVMMCESHCLSRSSAPSPMSLSRISSQIEWTILLGQTTLCSNLLTLIFFKFF
ncbi:hypothetical protein RND81_05G131500 [Saponaria officinalis]|uniref:Uncharacterized protein n=1 Tax=Saponaria officinalis TaxID=3572 RepID=A0AAW1KSD6_SAPOF